MPQEIINYGIMFFIAKFDERGFIMSFYEFISKEPSLIKPFKLFGTSHILALISVILFIAIFTKFSNRSETIHKYYKRFLLFMLPVQEILVRLWICFYQDFDLESMFSLHLCSMAIIFCTIILVKYNQFLFEIIYFWGLGGATQALLTPDISAYGFPHFRFFQVFLSHGLIIATVIYFIFVENKRIEKGSLKRILITTNIYAAFVFAVNMIFKTNYLFIGHKPETPSLIDMLGPWPFYIIWLELLMIIMFSLLYLPVLYAEKNRAKEELEASI